MNTPAPDKPICYLHPHELRKYRELCSAGKRLDAIKFLRQHAAVHSIEKGDTFSLRDSVFITDIIMNNPHDSHFIRVRNPIKSIVVDMGQGETTMSLPDMSLTFVSGLANGSISVETVSSLIDLYNLIKSWEDGLNSNKGN